MSNQIHVIRSSIVDLQFNGKVDGFGLQKEVDEWCHQQLMVLLGEVLHPYDEIQDIIRIDRLEVSVEANENDGWREKLTAEVRQQLKGKLDELANTRRNKGRYEITARQRFTEVLLFYLEKGYLPWWSLVKSKEELLEQCRLWIKNDLDEGDGLIRDALKNDVVRLRIVQHLPEDLFCAFVAKLHPALKDLLPSLLLSLEQITSHYTSDAKKKVTIGFRNWLLLHLDRGALQDVEAMTKDIFLLYSSMVNAPYLIEPGVLSSLFQHPEPLLIKVNDKVLEDDAIYINNAGLVILAPFLSTFFTRLHVSESSDITQPAIALSLLYYLVTGKEDAAEFELVLPKILCGIEIAEVVEMNVVLGEEQKAEADDLLLSVIEHWGILKNTSIDGLREAFLQRQGKLSFHKGIWLLQVEQKAYDMLLLQLPWDIGMIQLSWMRGKVKTEWI